MKQSQDIPPAVSLSPIPAGNVVPGPGFVGILVAAEPSLTPNFGIILGILIRAGGAGGWALSLSPRGVPGCPPGRGGTERALCAQLGSFQAGLFQGMNVPFVELSEGA